MKLFVFCYAVISMLPAVLLLSSLNPSCLNGGWLIVYIMAALILNFVVATISLIRITAGKNRVGFSITLVLSALPLIAFAVLVIKNMITGC